MANSLLKKGKETPTPEGYKVSPFYVKYGHRVAYQSQPRQTVFHTAVELASEGRGPRNILYGGAAGGGKTEALSWELYFWGTNEKWKNLKIGVFRKTYPEIEKFFIQRALDQWPNNSEEPIWTYRKKDHTITFHKTGTVIYFNYCENDSDVIRYQGAEFDILVFDEVTHHTEYVYKYLKTRHRTNKKGFVPITILATNPGNIGHAFIKRLYIDKDEYGIGEGGPDDYIFIPSKVWDNYALMESDPSYVENLKAMPEMDRRALLDGDWNIFAGQFFTDIRDDIHDFEPFSIPSHWQIIIALDYGFNPHPASVGWYAIDTEGNLYRYKELLVVKHTYSQLAKKIVEMTTIQERRQIQYMVIPHDLFAKRGGGEGKSGFEEMEDTLNEMNIDWLLVRADNNRVLGWGQLREYLKHIDGQDGKTARLRVCRRSCPMWWKQMPQMQHDPNKPEDMFKKGVEEGGKIWDGDDVADETRYAIMSRYVKPKDPNEKRKQKVDRYGAPIPTKSSYQKPTLQIQRGNYRGMDNRTK